MFERLTERARRALFFARDETSQVGSPPSSKLLRGAMHSARLPCRAAHAPLQSTTS
jgi:hypothetical protein